MINFLIIILFLSLLIINESNLMPSLVCCQMAMKSVEKNRIESADWVKLNLLINLTRIN